MLCRVSFFLFFGSVLRSMTGSGLSFPLCLELVYMSFQASSPLTLSRIVVLPFSPLVRISGSCLVLFLFLSCPFPPLCGSLSFLGVSGRILPASFFLACIPIKKSFCSFPCVIVLTLAYPFPLLFFFRSPSGFSFQAFGTNFPSLVLSCSRFGPSWMSPLPLFPTTMHFLRIYYSGSGPVP